MYESNFRGFPKFDIILKIYITLPIRVVKLKKNYKLMMKMMIRIIIIIIIIISINHE
jgi:hypothetical protein